MSLLYLAEHTSLVTGSKNMKDLWNFPPRSSTNNSFSIGVNQGKLGSMCISFPLDCPHLCLLLLSPITGPYDGFVMCQPGQAKSHFPESPFLSISESQGRFLGNLEGGNEAAAILQLTHVVVTDMLIHLVGMGQQLVCNCPFSGSFLTQSDS